MFIIIMGGGQPLDENSKRNPMKALVLAIEKAAELRKQAEQAWEEQNQAINLKLRDKVEEATAKLDACDMELMNAEMRQHQLLNIVPTVDNFIQN